LLSYVRLSRAQVSLTGERALSVENGFQQTHIAYSDESYSSASRYRSIAAITLEVTRDQEISRAIQDSLSESSVKEFKWEKLRQARDRFAAMRLIDTTLEFSMRGWLRVDVLIWDTHDSRHNIPGRDDIANFQRMYYHLFTNVLQRRWPAGSNWKLCPDENSALNWMAVQDYLDAAGVELRIEGDLFDEGGFRLRLAREFGVREICEMNSAETPLCQLADLFACLGAYSHLAYEKYESWVRDKTGQGTLKLGFEDEVELSNRDNARCEVIYHLNKQCKGRKLRVGLKSSKGFKSYDPAIPINFWPYEPQHPDDQAPTR
jgi:hypothetical protein